MAFALTNVLVLRASLDNNNTSSEGLQCLFSHTRELNPRSFTSMQNKSLYVGCICFSFGQFTLFLKRKSLTKWFAHGAQNHTRYIITRQICNNQFSLFSLMHCKEGHLYKIHYSHEIKIIYHCFFFFTTTISRYDVNQGCTVKRIVNSSISEIN